MTPILGIMASQISGHLTTPNNYESIATANGTGSSATISFTSIPATFKHLQIRFIARDNRATTYEIFNATFNSDTGNNYKRYHSLAGDGSAIYVEAGTSSYSSFLVGGVASLNGLASTMGTGIIDILDYTNANKYKTTRSLTGAEFNGYGEVDFWSGLWMSTSAISSITITSGTSTNFTNTTSFALYGIK